MKKISLKRYIAGCSKKGIDLNRLLLAGENLEDNTLQIELIDLPAWIEEGTRLKLHKKDHKLLKRVKKAIDNLLNNS